MDGSSGPTGTDSNYLGRYRVLAALGRGGMAEVHLAVMRGPAGFHKLLVLKQIHPHYAEDPEVLGMFLDEARLAARLSHPNVVQTNEVGQDGDRHFMAMEYLEGQPLNRILHRLSADGGLPLAMHLGVIVDLLGGLHYAHELTDYDGHPLGVVHRDINPQNIFVTYDGVVKVVDFGIAKARSSLVETRFGVVKGKVSYMAPEQARGESVDRRADIFAVGVMLWEAVTRTRPWKGVTELTAMKNLVRGKFPAVRAAAPDISEQLEDIILKALAPDRGDRYATAAELQADLEAYLEVTGERKHARELGRLISTRFASERAALKAVIEAQLRKDESAPPHVPILDAPTTPDVVFGRSGAGSSPRIEVHGLDLQTPQTGPSAFASSVPGAPVPAAGSRTSVRGWAAALAVAVLGVSVGLWVQRASIVPPRAPPAAALASFAPLAPLAPEPAATAASIRIAATPAEARIFLDGDPLEHNPAEEARPRDQAVHVIRVEAPGFVTRTESVTFDKDLAVDVVLAGSAAAEPEARPASTGSPRPVAKLRRLDHTNPYAGR